MKKEIIGYKLIKHEYEKAAVAICKSKGALDTENFKTSSQGISFTNTSFCKVWLEEAGVLDLWFEPVYKEELEFKEGEWLYLQNEYYRYLFRYNGLSNINKKGIATKEFYQITIGNTLVDSGECNNLTDLEKCTKATPKQIQEILTIVAKHKGFVVGTPFCNITKNTDGVIYESKWTYHDYYDALVNNGVYVYHVGKWGTVIKDELPVIDGNKGKIINSEVVYGCSNQYKYSKDSLIHLLTYMLDLDIRELIHTSGNVISEAQIRQMIKCLENGK